jgi:hypothetical protein
MIRPPGGRMLSMVRFPHPKWNDAERAPALQRRVQLVAEVRVAMAH